LRRKAIVKLRIGKINFLNLYPIFYTLEKECDPSRFEFIEGTPAELNGLLRDGELDISPSSSIEYLRNQEMYTLIEGHSISATGPIMSILLFSTLPIEELDKKMILASSQSETSTALLKIILKKFYRFDNRILISDSDLVEGLRSASAYMLIGDDALRAARSPAITEDPSHIHVYDLGEIWFRNTGLPFVYALWMGRKECCSEEAFIEFIERLDGAKKHAKDHFRDIASEMTKKQSMIIDDPVAYWNIISYDLNEDHKEGLKLFDRLIKEQGLL
jgi:chorismate dehydratase